MNTGVTDDNHGQCVHHCQRHYQFLISELVWHRLREGVVCTEHEVVNVSQRLAISTVVSSDAKAVHA